MRALEWTALHSAYAALLVVCLQLPMPYVCLTPALFLDRPAPARSASCAAGAT